MEYTKRKHDFCHLHNHSCYSVLDGMSRPIDMANSCVENGFDSIALTDHGTCGGWYAFQKACISKGVKPILGNEIYMCPDHRSRDPKDPRYHLVLLAKNYTGVQNLMKLSTIAETQGKYKKPRIDFDLLSKYHDGLICLSGCCIGELPTLLWQNQEQGAKDFIGEYKDLFGDDFYVEIMMHKYFDAKKDQEKRERSLAKQLHALAKEMNVKMVCSNDSHYTHKCDAFHHDVMLSMQTHNHIHNPNRFTFGGEEFYLRPYEEMQSLYSNVPQMMANTIEIAEKVERDAILVPSQDLLPEFKVPSGFKSDEAYLKALVTDGMKAMGLINKSEYRERIKTEISLIIKCGFVKYFLILWDIINYARQQKIRIGCGRGCFTPETKIQCKSGLKLIKDVSIDDEVLAYDGKYHEVTQIIDYDIDEEIAEIETDDGRKICCTLDHKIHVIRDGTLVFVEAKNLTEDDEIFDINNGVW